MNFSIYADKIDNNMKQFFILNFLLFILTIGNAQVKLTKQQTGSIGKIPAAALHIAKVFDIPMNYTYTGPVSAMSINPLNAQHIVIAGEGGGLFETRNAGSAVRNWKHLDEFMEHEVMDVLITPAAGGTNTWAACSNSFYKVKGPLLWRKNTDGQWVQVIFSSNTFSSPLQTYRVIYNSLNQKIYACGSFGVAIISKSSGGLTSPDINWKTQLISGPSGTSIYSLDILENGTIVAGCSRGVFALDSSLLNWRILNSELKFTEAGQRFCIHSDANRKIITVLGYNELTKEFKVYSTIDNGLSLQSFQTISNRLVPGAGGLTSIYPEYNISGKNLKIYVSNRFEINYASQNGNTIHEALRSMQFNASLSWSSKISGNEIGHADTRQIAFLTQGVFPPKCVVTSDGGFHIADIKPNKSIQDLSWVTENTESGLKSIQLTSVTGKNSEVFFATWHNGFGASLDKCNKFYNGPSGEGIVLSKQGILNNWDDRIFVTDGIGSQIRNSHIIFNIPGSTLDVNWNSPPNDFPSGDKPGPIYITGNTYIQQTNSTLGANKFDWNLTTTAGKKWVVVGTSEFRRYGVTTGIGIQKNNPGKYSIYVPVLDGVTIRLCKIDNPVNLAGATISKPELRSLSGGIANLDLGNTRNAVFSVNPFNSKELLACESNSGDLRSSLDGGNNWTPIKSFNSFYDNSDEPSLKSSAGYNSISVISYSPFTNGHVIIGTLSQGLYFSKDGGTNWIKLNNPGVLMCTGIHWISANEITVGTYGRGLFKINI